MFPVQGREQVRRRARGLRRPQQQDARGQQGVVEQRHHPLLHAGLEVDEHVPAADQVHAAERRIPGQVVPREDAHVADGLEDLVAAVPLAEEPAQAFGRDVLCAVRQVASRARLLERALGQIGAEDLEGWARLQLACRLEQADHERVDLLAGGATRHPHPHGRSLRPVPHQARQELLAQHFIGGGVAEEGRDRDEAVFVERSDLVRVAFEVARVLLQRLDVGERHAPRDPPLDGRRLVRAEVGARRLAQQGEDRPDTVPRLRRRRLARPLFPGRSGDVGVAAEACELLRDALGRQDVVHAIRRDDAARHAVVRGRGRVLGEDDAAFRLDRLRSERPVRARPGQDHADRPAALGLGQRAQEGVDRQVAAARGDARDQLQHTPFEGDVALPRGDVDVVGLDCRVLLELGDRHPAALGQQLGQDALVVGVQVLHEHVGHARVVRQRSQQQLERVQAAGRGTDADDREGAFRQTGPKLVRLASQRLRRGRSHGLRSRSRRTAVCRLPTHGGQGASQG